MPKLREFLHLVDRAEKVVSDKLYRQVGVRVWGKGAYERESILGLNTKYTKFSKVRADDIIVNKIWARNGSIAIVTGELDGLYCSSEFPLFVVDEKKVRLGWVKWLIKTPWFWKQCMEKSGGTSGKNRITPNQFLEINVELPPLDKQTEIFRRLDDSTPSMTELGLISKENSILIRDLQQYILQEAVSGKLGPQDHSDEPASELLKKIKIEKEKLIKEGKIGKEKELPPITEKEIPFEIPVGWVWARLGEITTKIGSGSTPLGGRKIYEKTGIPFIRSQNVWDTGLELDDVVYITEDIHKKMEGTRVFQGDILLNITGASIGRTCIVPDNFNEGNVSQHVSIIRLVSSSITRFIHFFLLSSYLQKKIMDVQVGVSREGLSKKNMELFLIPIPSLSEQNRITQKLDYLIKVCIELEDKIEENQNNSELLMEAVLKEALAS